MPADRCLRSLIERSLPSFASAMMSQARWQFAAAVPV